MSYSRRRYRRKYTRKRQSFFTKPQTASEWIILLAVAGVVLTSPYGGKVITKLIKTYLHERGLSKEEQRRLESRNISQALYNLKKRKIIQIKEKNGKVRIILTEKGRIRKLVRDMRGMNIPKPDTWDRSWRFLIFDIPEAKNVVRNAFRSELKRLGFIQFQQSVWIYPYPCEGEIDFLAEYFKVNKYLTLLTARIKDDKVLRDKFPHLNL
ncbi:MAG: hypothetical protein WD889_00310 [Candidatus Colwellbacteria bacterium]